VSSEFCGRTGCLCPVPSDERVLLAQRLYVALVEARNLDCQRYGEFQTAPIEPGDAWWRLNAVAAEAS
jgi:hypothetical protein